MSGPDDDDRRHPARAGIDRGISTSDTYPRSRGNRPWGAVLEGEPVDDHCASKPSVTRPSPLCNPRRRRTAPSRSFRPSAQSTSRCCSRQQPTRTTRPRQRPTPAWNPAPRNARGEPKHPPYGGDRRFHQRSSSSTIPRARGIDRNQAIGTSRGAELKPPRARGSARVRQRAMSRAIGPPGARGSTWERAQGNERRHPARTRIDRSGRERPWQTSATPQTGIDLET